MTQENELSPGELAPICTYPAHICEATAEALGKMIDQRDQDKQAIRERDASIKELVEWLVDNGEHTRECIWSRCDAGRPTESGGYENKFAGKWYQSKPVDKLPQCTCKLHKLISKYSLEKK